MTPAPLPLTRDLVLIGGGHTHALVLRKWGMHPLPGARLTLINPGPTAPYTGMLPGHVAGHYSRDELLIDLVRLARFAGARLIFGAATCIDRAARRIHVTGRAPVAYDIASINVGITSDLPSLAGFAAHGVGAKPLGPYARAWRAFRAAVKTGDVAPRIAVIGAGVGGVELSMAMAHALRQDGADNATITVIEKHRALPGMGDAARRRCWPTWTGSASRCWKVPCPKPSMPRASRLRTAPAVPARFTVGAAGARPQGWLAETGLDLADGFVSVDTTLRTSDPAIYAAGDCAHLSHAPRPKAGVFAVREAPVLHHNLRAGLTGGSQRRYNPQRDYLKLISLGGKIRRRRQVRAGGAGPVALALEGPDRRQVHGRSSSTCRPWPRRTCRARPPWTWQKRSATSRCAAVAAPRWAVTRWPGCWPDCRRSAAPTS